MNDMSSLPSRADEHQDVLRVFSECPLCAHKYKRKEISLVEEDGNTQLVHIFCGECKHALLACIMVSHVGLGTVGMITDLSAEDAIRVRDNVIESDDVLHISELLQSQFSSHIFIKHKELITYDRNDDSEKKKSKSRSAS